MSKEAGITDRMFPAWICGLDVNEDFKVELTVEEYEFVWGENYSVMW